MTDIHELASEINRKRRLSIAKAIFDDIEKLGKRDTEEGNMQKSPFKSDIRKTYFILFGAERWEELKKKWLE